MGAVSVKEWLDPASQPPGVCDDPEATSSSTHATTVSNKKENTATKVGNALPMQEGPTQRESSADPPPGACDDPKAKSKPSLLGKAATDSNTTKNGGRKKNKAPSLSIDNIVSALKSLIDQWRDVGEWLRIPYKTLDIIKSESTTPGQCLKAVVRYWLMKDPLASWRRLIYLLDGRKIYHEVTDKIRCNAEKLQDPTLTRSNVLAALQTLEDEKAVDSILDTPVDIYRHLNGQHAGTTLRTALVDYYLQNSPVASWEHLAGTCLCEEKDSAFQAVKAWIRPKKDSTLTTSRLAQLLKDVSQYSIRKWLHVPVSVFNAITPSHTEVIVSLCEWYVGNHPAPSWSHVAGALYYLREHEALEMLKDEVPSLKGSKGSRDMFSKYMKLGYVESCIGKMLVYGACGTGKSSFMDLMVGNSPRLVRKSTPLAARPVAVFQLDASGEKKWAKLNKVQRKKILIKALMSVQSQQDQAEDNAPKEEDVQGETSTSDNQQAEHQHHPVKTDNQKTHPTPSTQSTRYTKAEAAPTPATAEEKEILKSVSTCDDLVSLIQQCSASGEATTSYRKILLIDSGGQPQFHVILPVFLRRMSLYVFVFKLSDELDGKPSVEYYDASGKSLGKPYKSAQTNKQLLQHCLRTLHTHRSSSKSKASKILVVGTHRDIEAQCTTEKREDKEKKLLELLLPMFQHEVVYSSLYPKKFIFALNAKNPELEDRALVEKIQQLVTTECSPQPVKIPLHYFALELVLEEASEKLGRGILSIEECLEAAAELHFDHHTLDLALQYLDELSVVFYFPEVLEGVLFINTQVLLDKATELVQKQYQLREGSNAGVAEWQTFLENAVFDVKFLSKPEFSKHYLPGLFTQVELVKLFKKLLIFADFHGDKLFMPALLRVLKEEEVSEYCAPADSPAAPLALEFPLGGPRLGVFCALSCFLASSSNQFPGPWKIKLDPEDETPMCLYCNCIRFSIPRFPGSVTMVDTFSHFQVHVRTREERYGDVCSVVRQAVVAGLRSVTTTLGYGDCSPSLAFVCPCRKGIPHVATVEGGDWVCNRDSDESGKADARYQIWESKKGYLGRDAPVMADLTFIKNKDGAKFQLLSLVSLHWKSIAEVLGLDDVERIAAQYKNNVDDKVRHVFTRWFENASELPWSEHYPLSWHGLNELLIDSELAEIAKQYFAFLDTCN